MTFLLLFLFGLVSLLVALWLIASAVSHDTTDSRSKTYYGDNRPCNKQNATHVIENGMLRRTPLGIKEACLENIRRANNETNTYSVNHYNCCNNW